MTDCIMKNLSWENTDQYDIGLDMDFLNYRLGIVLDYYYRYTDDLLNAGTVILS
ncbi:MAG: hypothetical protein V8R91_05650 [Butyricimonas faecihominis]